MARQIVGLSKKQRILIVIAGAIVILFGGWALGEFMPKPLGDRLEYLGKENYGGGLFFRDYDPYSRYFYGTDLSEENLKTHFKGANYKRSRNILTTPEYRGRDIEFNSSQGEFTITLYNDKQAITKNIGLRPTSKQHVISVTDSDYKLLKRLLQ